MRQLSLVLLVLAGCASHRAPAPQPQLVPVTVEPAPRTPEPVTVSQEVLAQRALCEARDDLYACVIVALAFESGDGAPADLPTAARYYHLACDARIAEACALLVNLYSAGGEGVAPDPAQVARLKQGLCEDGHELHCPPVVEEQPFSDEPIADEP